MSRRKIKIKAIKRQEPDVRLYVLALIELAQQLQAETERREQTASEPGPRPEGDHA